MSIADILWLFFMFSMVQPVIQQKMLEASRLRLLHRLERERKSRMIALVHRQETMSLLGFQLMRYIDVNDSEEVALRDRPPPDVVVVSPDVGRMGSSATSRRPSRSARPEVGMYQARGSRCPGAGGSEGHRRGDPGGG